MLGDIIFGNFAWPKLEIGKSFRTYCFLVILY